MRARVGVPLAILGFCVYMFSMMTLNKYVGVYENSAKARPVVAGVSTERKMQYVPETTHELTNSITAERAKRSLPELTQDLRLDAVAVERALDMVANSYYAHTSPDGQTFVDLFTQNNVPSTTYACENLLLSSSMNIQNALVEWLASPSHKACMLDAQMTRVGVFSIEFDSATKQQLFVAVFANGI